MDGEGETDDDVEETLDGDGAVPPGEIVGLDRIERRFRWADPAVKQERGIPESGGEDDSEQERRRTDRRTGLTASSVILSPSRGQERTS